MKLKYNLSITIIYLSQIINMKKHLLLFVFLTSITLFSQNNFKSWQYALPIKILNKNNVGSDTLLQNQQISIKINTKALIAAGKMKSDASDIRFVDSLKLNSYHYWFEPHTLNTDSTQFWVKVTRIKEKAYSKIFLLYGNTNASSFANGDSTFLFFDDFNANSINTNKWSVKNTVTASNGQIYLTAGSGIKSNINFNTYETVITGRVYFGSANDYMTWFGWGDYGSGWGFFGDGACIVAEYGSPFRGLRHLFGGWTQLISGNAGFNSYNNWTFEIDNTYKKCAILKDYNFLNTNNSSYAINSKHAFFARHPNCGSNAEEKMDWVYVRKSNTPLVKTLILNETSNCIVNINILRDTTICKKDSVKVTVSDGFKSYLWSSNDTGRSIFIKQTSKINVVATDSFGCKAYDTAIISILNPVITPKDTIVCKGESVTLKTNVIKPTTNTTCGYIPNSLKSGLVAWYPFCGNANDESGNGNNGVASNGASLINDHRNITNSAFNFDGIDDIINTNLSYIKLLRSKGFSVSAWVNLGTSTTFYSYSIVNNMNPSATQFWMGLEGTQNNGANHRKPTLFFNSFNGGSQAITVPNYTVQTNTWTHLTFSLKNNTIWFYANGILTYTKSVNFDSLSTEAPAPNVKIGRGNLTPGFYQDFNGSIDEVGIWNRALSASEVAQLYNLQSNEYPTKLTWSTSDTSITTKLTVNNDTMIWLKTTDGIGTCYDTATIFVSKPKINIQDSILFKNCNRDSMLVNIGSNWNSVNWSNGYKDSITYLKKTGNYYVNAKNKLGCITFDSTYFINPGKPQITSLIADSVNCFDGNDGSIISNFTGGSLPYRFLWNDLSKQTTSNANNLNAGKYQLVIFDAYNCKDSMSKDVYQPSKLSLNITATDSVNCFGGSDGSAKVNVTGGTPNYSYVWNDQNQQISSQASNLKKGTYKVIVSDYYACKDSISTNIEEPSKVKVNTSNIMNITCFGYDDGSALANANGGTGLIKYEWNTSPKQSNPLAINLTKGTHKITVIDVYGCSDSATINITEPEKIIPTIEGGRIAVRDISHNLSSSVTPLQTYTYQWKPSSVFGNSTNQSSINGVFQSTTLVTLRATDNDGCYGEDTATITVLMPFILQMPNAFSPNNDGINDVFKISDYFDVEQLEIYNRWGELLFKGDAKNPTWDGKFNNTVVPIGSYLFMVKAKLKNSSYSFEHQGTVTVIK
jgi:gliding motility-associated-like protein